MVLARVHAELTLGMGVHVSERLAAVLMSMSRIVGLPSVGEVERLRGVVAAGDLVNQKFHRPHPNELWVADITEHPTREGKVYCCAVLDAFSQRIIGWSIDTVQNFNLVVNALDMAIKNRQPFPRWNCSRRSRRATRVQSVVTTPLS
jgi:transposase InsO family protein